MPTPKFTNEILAAAIAGFEQQKSQLESKIAELKAMLAGGHSAPAVVAAKRPAKKTKRRISAEGRRRIIAANKRMWEARRAAAKSAPPIDKKKISAKKP